MGFVELELLHIPPARYAIVSHRWADESKEVFFTDIGDPARAQGKDGYHKIQGACAQATHENIDYVWLDTCCIDRSNSTELSEAINSMYKWYHGSTVCYAYLYDVSDPSKFIESDWFSRGWTLQELIAPRVLKFFTKDWRFIGTREELVDPISRRTGIDPDILRSAAIPREVTISQKMIWMSERETTKIEDRSYSMLGILGISVYPIYGIGDGAFENLQHKLISRSSDQTLFSWFHTVTEPEDVEMMDPDPDFKPPTPESEAHVPNPPLNTTGLLAPSPSYYLRSYQIPEPEFRKHYVDDIRDHAYRSQFSFSNNLIRIQLPMKHVKGRVWKALLRCSFDPPGGNQRPIVIYLREIQPPWKFARVHLVLEKGDQDQEIKLDVQGVPGSLEPLPEAEQSLHGYSLRKVDVIGRYGERAEPDRPRQLQGDPHMLPGSSTIASTAAYPWTATPFNPASIPLAVRSPYLSAWLPQGKGRAINKVWPEFRAGGILGWAGYVRVDGRTYVILGGPVEPGASPFIAKQQSMQFTATSTKFRLNAGPVDVILNFISPVEPLELVKQSTPFSYLTVQAVSTDGKAHAVSVYTDITGEWVSPADKTQVVVWQSSTTGPVFTHQVMLQTQQAYTVCNNFIMQGAVYYSTTNNGNATTYQTGHCTVVRIQFMDKGVLANTFDTNFRPIDEQWPVFAFAHDLGMVSGTSDTIVFTIGHVRDPVVEYIVAGGAYQARSLYCWSKYQFGIGEMIGTFLNDYPDALLRAQEFDEKVKNDASAISSNYAGIVQLSIRQAFGAMELTISQNGDGSWNTNDVLMFLDGMCVNTVDIIMPAWPLLLYTNPTLGKYLLLGLFEYQATGQWPETYAVHDLGSTYPMAIGHNDGVAEEMPLEECGNMLIMTLSYTQKTGDTSIVTRYFDLLRQWTGYLVSESLIPPSQISTDIFAGALANQTNLAIKGVIGIQAMAEISGMLGDTASQQNYSSIVASYVPRILNFAISKDGQHLDLSYLNDASWGLSYNLYADRLLGMNVFPQSVYDMQTAWYAKVVNKYGIPLDTRHTYTKSDWQIWTAAFMTNTTTRDMFIDAVYKYAANGENSVPLSDWYDTISGMVVAFGARPVVGGHLALLVV